MSERKMEKLGGGSTTEREPILAYYKFKEPNPEYPKEKQFKKGDSFKGTYQHTFIKTTDDGYVYKDHLIKDESKGQLTLANCTALSDLEGLARGTYVEIEYLGKGKAKPGKRPPYLFSVSVDKSGTVEKAPAPKNKKMATKEIPDLSEEDADEEGDGVPF